MRPEKTVYVLGAGFSCPADAPRQAEIIADVLNLRNQLPPDTILRCLEQFETFLEHGLYIGREDWERIPLEDIFTPIDRCILDGISFRQYSVKDLVEIREHVYALIIYAIRERLRASKTKKDYIGVFASHLVQKMKPRSGDIKLDPVSVISTNWDILLDNSIHESILKDKRETNIFGVVDYCCYVSSLEDDDSIKAGLYALGKQGYNVKLLKLHGSMNWLQCPKCQRLFVAFNEKIAALAISGDERCKYCRTDTGDQKFGSAANLTSNMIMPTFLKDLNNFQIKLIWQNASVELAEATKVVFIGYSLPYADYELRQLLSRSVSHTAEIEVVMSPEQTPGSKESNDLMYERYQIFFGKRKLHAHRIGAEEYVHQFIK